jgi:hypothetical protein
MLRGLSSPPVNVVAVDRYIDYRVAKYTTDGVVDDSRFSVETLSRYVAELQGYLDLIDTLKDAVMVVSRLVDCTLGAYENVVPNKYIYL